MTRAERKALSPQKRQGGRPSRKKLEKRLPLNAKGLTYIEWYDSASDARWHYPHDGDYAKPSPALCKSVGFVVGEDSRALIIATTISEAWNGRHYLTTAHIPKTCISLRMSIQSATGTQERGKISTGGEDD